MSDAIVIPKMTVEELIVALQTLVVEKPALAKAGVTYQIPEGGSVPISKIEVYAPFGYIRICDPRNK